MTRCIALFTPLVISIILMSGCPVPAEVPSVLVGAWTYTEGGGSLPIGINLLADGTVTQFQIDNGPALPSPLTWEVDGTEFTMRAGPNGARIIYGGRVTSDTSISGARVVWEGLGTGSANTWTAVKM